MPLTCQSVTRAIAKALLKGHRDAVATRAVALAIHAGEITVGEAVRRFGYPASTLYAAKGDVSEAILSELRALTLTNRINGSEAPSKPFPVNQGTLPAGAAKLFLE